MNRDRMRLELMALEDRSVPSASNPLAPTANDDFTDTDGSNPVIISVLQNDAAVGGKQLVFGTLYLRSQPQNGFATVEPATGEITYTAFDFFKGTDTFRYAVSDSSGLESNIATVTVVVNRPTANDDFADTDGNNPVTINVLANDTDPDGNDQLDPATVKVWLPIEGGLHGTINVEPVTGAIKYTAIGDFAGTDRFQYSVADKAGGESAPAMVTVVVNRPFANPDSAFTFGSKPVTVNVLANDTDPDGNGELDASSVKIISQPAHGTATVDPATGAITYTPSGTYVGTDVLTYTVTDFPGAESNAAAVRIKVGVEGQNLFTVAAPQDGGGPIVNILNSNGTIRGQLLAYESTFRGGVRVAVGDVDGDGTPDIVTGAGVGGAPLVKVFSGVDLREISSFFAFDQDFRGGVNVAVGDVDGDGLADVIAGAGDGGSPRVVVYTHAPTPILVDPLLRVPAVAAYLLEQTQSFFAYDSTFTGGVRVAAGDVNGDGVADIITAPGAGGSPHVKVFDGKTGDLLHSFFAFDSTLTNGVNVAAGDVNGDGFADIITGIGPGGGPHVKVFDGATGAVLYSFFAYDPKFSGGVQVAAADVNLDGRADLVLSAGPGLSLPVLMMDGDSLAPLHSAAAFTGFEGGIDVGGAG